MYHPATNPHPVNNFHKKGEIPETANDVKPPTHVRWHCRKCGETGTLPILDTPDAFDAAREAIRRGHHRRAFACAASAGSSWIWLELNGKRFRFMNWDGREFSDAGQEAER